MSMDDQDQDTFINGMKRLHPSKHVIFRIFKLSSKSNVDQSEQRSTESQTLLQNRETELQRQGKLSFIIGSYYEKTKVERPDEMDVMFIFAGDLQPQNFFKCVLPRSSESYIFVNLQRIGLLSDRNFECWRDYLSEDKSKLCPEKLFKAFETQVKMAVENLWKPREVRIKKFSDTGGPAIALGIDRDKYSVDIVLGIHFDGWPRSAQSVLSSKDTRNNWITKDVQRHLEDNGYDVVVKTIKSEYKFRLSFSRAEKYLLTETLKGCERRCLRIGKFVLSDNKSSLHPLCSYHLKTILLKIRYEHPTRKDWEEGKLAERFCDFISALIDGVKEKNISNFFVSRHNLMNEWGRSDTERVAEELENSYIKFKESV